MHNPALHFDHLNPPASSFKATNVFAGFFLPIPPCSCWPVGQSDPSNYSGVKSSSVELSNQRSAKSVNLHALIGAYALCVLILRGTFYVSAWYNNAGYYPTKESQRYCSFVQSPEFL